MTDLVPLKRAFLSVHDKTGIAALGRALHDAGVELASTGGTARALSDAGLPVVEVSTLTGFPEILGGRVKTLHPAIHGGILARRHEPGDTDQLATHGIAPIDLVVVSLYPFERTVTAGATTDEAIEQIDIGGVALIRAAAKNHTDVAVVTEPEDYAAVIAALTEAGGTRLALRRRLAARAFAHTARYDSAIATWAAAVLEDGATPLPARLLVASGPGRELRYGENPHQSAAFYPLPCATPGTASLAAAEQIQGKELSYNNLLDADAALAQIAELERPGVVIVKHGNPCGVAVGDDLVDAYRRARACDPVSAFGGIIAVNRPLDGATASAIIDLFAEVVIAPQADADARAALAAKTNLRLLLTPVAPDPARLRLRSVAGGLLAQDEDLGQADPEAVRVVTDRAPTPTEHADLLFAMRVAKHVRSNAIVLARGGATVGIGAGQMSRVDSVRLAVDKATRAAAEAGEQTPWSRCAVLASDAFFPFPDGLEAAAEAGVVAVIQPGGSRRDDAVVAAANAAGMAMLFTGRRHFRH